MTPSGFGKYRVLARLGQGGAGTVYLGHDPHLKRPVAIKTCVSLEPMARRRLEREAELIASLDHPNITTVHDFGVEDGVPYLVQEHLSGEDLSARIARREPLPLLAKVDCLIAVAEALAYAHRRGVVHRDVKPSNVRWLADGRVKLMDFGVAHELHDEEACAWGEGATGTAGYLPPEQIRGEAGDRRADVFSFGVLAYELLSYRRPFAGATVREVLRRIQAEEPQPLSELVPGCPRALVGLVHRCLAKPVEERFAGFEEVLERLAQVRCQLLAPASGSGLSAWLGRVLVGRRSR